MVGSPHARARRRPESGRARVQDVYISLIFCFKPETLKHFHFVWVTIGSPNTVVLEVLVD